MQLLRQLNMERWCGKVAIVTGASSGIGRAIAEALTKAGCHTIGLARREAKLIELKQSLSSVGKFDYKICDMSDQQSIEQTFDAILAEHGPVHVLINNAGTFVRGALYSQPPDVINAILNTNLTGVLWAARAAIKIMRDHKIAGQIININSVLGHHLPTYPMEPSYGAYATSKHALTCMLRVLRHEMAANKTGIKITSLSPGLVETELTDDLIKSQPTMPFIMPEDINSSILFLLSTPPNVMIRELTIGSPEEML